MNSNTKLKISVYLGSSPVCQEKYNVIAYDMGREIALRGATLVYGGAAVGTMGRLADGAKDVGGEVIGVFPKGFTGTREVREKGISVVRDGLDEMIEVENFAVRKQVMEDIGDCAVILPGSFGTLDELFTYACNRSIDKNDKHMFILNFEGYYNPLIQLIDNMIEAGMFKPCMHGAISFHDTVSELMDAVADYFTSK